MYNIEGGGSRATFYPGFRCTATRLYIQYLHDKLALRHPLKGRREFFNSDVFREGLAAVT